MMCADATEPDDTLPPAGEPPRILLFGIRCRFTERVLQCLIGHGAGIAGIVVPGPPGTIGLRRVPVAQRVIPLAGQAGSVLSGSAGVPVFHAGSMRSLTSSDVLRSLAPDVIVVACYPRLIPAPVRAAARVAALNIHPSLLPQGRGPDPLFWTLRRGNGRAGVTVHELTDTYDAGPILVQQSFRYPDAISEDRLELLAAEIGARLALHAIHQLVDGSATSHEQDDALASSEPSPAADDYVIDTNRPARHAFNFIRGVAGRATSVTIRTPQRDVNVETALAYSNHGSLPRTTDDRVTHLSFHPGELAIRERLESE
jgi:methionyl-tRNA formyltransferase